MKTTLLNILLILNLTSLGQADTTSAGRAKPVWWQADIWRDSLPGISLERAYEYLKGRKAKPIIIAIIDGCIDTAHQDLQNILWTNKKEIPVNGVDDDHNGYVDDIHGWCYVANKNNEYENAGTNDQTRIYKIWRNKFEKIDVTRLKSVEKLQYQMYLTSKKTVLEKYNVGLMELATLADSLRKNINEFTGFLQHILAVYRDTAFSKVPFAALPFTNENDSLKNAFWSACQKSRPFPPNPPDPTVGYINGLIRQPARADGFLARIIETAQRFDTTKDFRSVVGDDPADMNDVHYGTNAINILPSAHGSEVTGIIAANRWNNIGIRGICDSVLIMSLVASVKGNLSDKDIILAARYAIDNGASIINMSFGGDLSDHVKESRELFDYAYRKNVLIVNGAGNGAKKLDSVVYWTGQSTNGKELDNYIRVGATTEKLNENLVSNFSNYGRYSVDLFAPGSSILTTIPDNKYTLDFGTSLSSPMVAGVAALLWSYFPHLTAIELKVILMKTAYRPVLDVIIPGTKKRIAFSNLSKSGGILNAYNAVVYADQMNANKDKRQ